MAPYLNPETNEYPRYDGDIQLLFPEWSPEDSLPEPWVSVVETSQPEPTFDYITYESAPELVDGVWTMTWDKRPMTKEEKERRDEILQKETAE